MPTLRSLAPLVAIGLVACSSADPAGGGGAASSGPTSDDGGSGVTLGGTTPMDDGGGATSPSSSGGATTPTPGADGSAPAPVVCAPSWTVSPGCGAAPGGFGPAPDLGPNVLVFDPSMGDAAIQTQLSNVYGQQDSAQFGTGRYALLFKPGQYALDVQVGFYTQVLGLGQSPNDVQITGAVRAKADWLGSNNATCNFWRGAENFAVTPTQAIDGAVNVWAISQGTALRRAHVQGSIALDDGGGWSSGGFIADTVVDAQISSGSQQQFLTRNDDLGSWQGSNWNMVFVGDHAAPASSWPDPPFTTTDATPKVREKPFLYLDAAGHYLVMVPALKTNSVGASWGSGAPPGSPLSIDLFYVARPADTAATINSALAQGKHLLFTPGIYHLEAPLAVTRPGTVVLGLGFPTLITTAGNAILNVADVDDVTVAGVLLEAGTQSSPVLLHVGSGTTTTSHASAPTALLDVHCRIGGADDGTAESCVTIDSNDVLVDNTWLWRADHGAGAAWDDNKSKNGLVVNGANVTVYGLFVEHFEEYQTLWNGNGGAVYFYQSEMPYDPPSQSAWMEPSGANGYASYKVADGVTSHTAQGLGVYSVFSNDVSADNAIEAPTVAGVSMHHMVTVSLASGSIQHIIDGTGGTVAQGGSMVAKSTD
jgi:hypothetical protein